MSGRPIPPRPSGQPGPDCAASTMHCRSTPARSTGRWMPDSGNSPRRQQPMSSSPCHRRSIVSSCHADACVPNTLIDTDGHCVGHVDLDDLGRADRCAWTVVGRPHDDTDDQLSQSATAEFIRRSPSCSARNSRRPYRRVCHDSCRRQPIAGAFHSGSGTGAGRGGLRFVPEVESGLAAPDARDVACRPDDHRQPAAAEPRADRRRWNTAGSISDPHCGPSRGFAPDPLRAP